VAAAVNVSADVYLGVAELNPSLLKAFSPEEVAAALHRDEAKARHILAKEEWISHRTICEARVEAREVFVRYQLLQSSLVERSGLRDAEVAAWAALWDSHCEGLKPVLAKDEKAARQRVGRLQNGERDILAFRFRESKEVAVRRRNGRIAVLVQRFARAHQSKEVARGVWQAQCDEMAALAQMEARHWDLLRQTLGEYIAAFEDVEAEEAQRRLHIAKRYDVCTFEAWALERVRVLQQEAEARHAVLTLEGQGYRDLEVQFDTDQIQLSLLMESEEEVAALIEKAETEGTEILEDEFAEFAALLKDAMRSYTEVHKRDQIAEEEALRHRALDRFLRAEITARAQLVVVQEQVWNEILLRLQRGVLRQRVTLKERFAFYDEESKARAQVMAEYQRRFDFTRERFEQRGIVPLTEAEYRSRKRLVGNSLEAWGEFLDGAINKIAKQLQWTQADFEAKSREEAPTKSDRSKHNAQLKMMRDLMGSLRLQLAKTLSMNVEDSWILDPRSNPAATKIQAQQRGFVARQRAKRMQKANFRQKQVAHQETVKRTEELREQAEMFAAEAHSVYNDITITHDMRTVEHRETEQRQFLLASERRDWRALQQQDISGQMMRVLPEASASLAPEIHEEQRLKAQAASSDGSEKGHITKLCQDLLDGLNRTLQSDAAWGTKVRILQREQHRLPPLQHPSIGSPLAQRPTSAGLSASVLDLSLNSSTPGPTPEATVLHADMPLSRRLAPLPHSQTANLRMGESPGVKQKRLEQVHGYPAAYGPMPTIGPLPKLFSAAESDPALRTP